MIARLLAIRDAAIARGDRTLAVEAQMELNRHGYVEHALEPIEQAIPVKRPRGRPRKVVDV